MENYSIEDIFNVAGKTLTEKMINVFSKEDKAVNWFYQPNKLFDGKTPYDLCMEGKLAKIDIMLRKIEYRTKLKKEKINSLSSSQ